MHISRETVRLVKLSCDRPLCPPAQPRGVRSIPHFFAYAAEIYPVLCINLINSILNFVSAGRASAGHDHPSAGESKADRNSDPAHPRPADSIQRNPTLITILLSEYKSEGRPELADDRGSNIGYPAPVSYL